MLNLSNGAMKKYQDLQSYLKDFDYVTLDLQGYRTGSMNETLKQ